MGAHANLYILLDNGSNFIGDNGIYPKNLNTLTLCVLMDSSFWFDITITWNGPMYVLRGHRL